MVSLYMGSNFVLIEIKRLWKISVEEESILFFGST